MSLYERVSVIGAGAWGVALAHAAARAGRDVTLWARSEADAEAMRTTRRAPRLPEAALPDAVTPTADLALAAGAAGRLGGIGELSGGAFSGAGSRAVLLAVPVQATRAVMTALGPLLAPTTPVIVCSKGLERGTALSPAEIVALYAPASPVAALSGPSFAADVAAGRPTAVVLACPLSPLAQALAAALNGPSFRVYHSSDLRGVEIGGAAKNVLAIAAGIVEGRGLGESAKAALVARGFAEMGRIARALGAKPQTLMGLSGLGDLVLTCASARSRNFTFGLALGRGQSLEEAASGGLAEGAATAATLVELAAARGVEMPICAAVAQIVVGAARVDETVEALMSRPAAAESDADREPPTLSPSPSPLGPPANSP